MKGVHKMKKTVSMVLVCVLLACTLLTLASCGKSLSGKYEADLSILGTYTYEFGAFGKVTKTVDPIAGNNTVSEGKYEINEAGDKITLTFENADGGEESTTYSFVEGEENGVNSRCGKLVAGTLNRIFIGHKRLNLAFTVGPVFDMMLISALVVQPGSTVSVDLTAHAERRAIASVIFYTFKKFSRRKF